MKPGQQLKEAKPNSIKHTLLGLYGILGISVSAFGFRVPFAEDNAKEHWRHALAGILIFIILVASVIGFAIYIFDANYFKSQMVDYVKENHQRDLTLEGDIKVTFFPKLGLDSGKMTLSQRNGGKTFTSVENVRLYIAWWPLLRKQLEIEHVVLDGLHTNIIRHKNGSTNLDDFLSTDGNLANIKFEIDSIKINNSSVNLQDEISGKFLTLHDLNIETGKITDSTLGNVSANFRLESNSPRIDTKAKINSHILFDLKSNHYELSNFDGEIEGEAAGINNLSLTFMGTIKRDPELDRLTVDKFSAFLKGKLENRKLEAKINIPKLQLIGDKASGSTISFSTTLLQEQENLSASIELPAFEVNNKILQAENISATFDLFQAGHSLQGKLISPLSYNFATQELQLPTIDSQLNISHPALASKLTAKIDGSFLAKLAEQNIKLDLKSQINDSNIIGSIGLQDFTRPTYSFNLGANKLDLDQYLAADWNKHLQDDAIPFDFSALKDLNMHGKLRCNELKFAKLQTRNFVTDIRIEQSTLLMEPFNALLYKGGASGSISITAGEIPKLTFKQKLTGVQINALLADLFPGDAKLTGKGNLALDLAASGENLGALRKSLNGSISLALTRGSVAGINLTEILVEGKNQLGIKDAERNLEAKFTDTTAFTELKSTFELNEGKAKSNNLSIKSNTYIAKGEGEIDIESGQLDYHLDHTVAANLRRKSNGELAELRGISIPMRITGPYSAPSFKIDFGAATGGSIAKLNKPNIDKAAIPVSPASKPVKK